jgi:protein-tyrosine-phosphatase
MSDKILFLCPHGAAKSIMAAAYFQHLAQAQGLDFVADSASTDPDSKVSTAVMTLLQNEGIQFADQTPRQVTQADLDDALRVVSLGCTLEEFAVDESRLRRWDDVPPVSENIAATRAAILARVEQLINELA